MCGRKLSTYMPQVSPSPLDSRHAGVPPGKQFLLCSAAMFRFSPICTCLVYPATPLSQVPGFQSWTMKPFGCPFPNIMAQENNADGMECGELQTERLSHPMHSWGINGRCTLLQQPTRKKSKPKYFSPGPPSQW